MQSPVSKRKPPHQANEEQPEKKRVKELGEHTSLRDENARLIDENTRLKEELEKANDLAEKRLVTNIAYSAVHSEDISNKINLKRQVDGLTNAVIELVTANQRLCDAKSPSKGS